MIVATFWQHPAVIGLLVAIPSFTIAYLGYKRSVKVDKVAEQAGIATANTASIGQVVDGLNGIVENLQDDNRVLREEIARCHTRIDEIDISSADLRTRNSELEREVRELRAENEELRQVEASLTARILVLENGQQSKGAP